MGEFPVSSTSGIGSQVSSICDALVWTPLDRAGEAYGAPCTEAPLLLSSDCGEVPCSLVALTTAMIASPIASENGSLRKVDIGTVQERALNEEEEATGWHSGTSEKAPSFCLNSAE